MKSSMTNAIIAANRAADITSGRLQLDLASLHEQDSELEQMTKVNPVSDEDRANLDLFRAKLKKLDAGCSDLLFK